MPRDYAVVIPTLNAEKYIQPLLRSLEAQTLPPREIIVVDSASDDGTVRLAQGFPGVRVIPVDRRDFDHGGTRDMAIRACDAPYAVLMTQDALPTNENCMAALLEPLADETVAAVCARQIARPEASAAERAVRAFRYADTSVTWSKADVPAMGVRAYLLSDVCAAYRRDAYLAVGGFEHPIATNEDMLIAADFLDAGWHLAYRADARVWHSHSFTLRQEYRRNRLIGAFLAEYGHRFGAGELGEGLQMVLGVTRTLIKTGAWGELFPFWMNCGARFLGSRAGKRAGRRGLKHGQSER